jgi:nitrogen fixation NifU-like protein
MYTEKVMDHFANPRNVGELPDANAIGQVGNPKCGDIMKIYMKIEDEVIKDISFKTFGCGAAIATSSMATELVKGKTIQDALALTIRPLWKRLTGCLLRKYTARFSQSRALRRLSPTTTSARVSTPSR